MCNCMSIVMSVTMPCFQMEDEFSSGVNFGIARGFYEGK